jgi:hypothetical protein
VPRKHRATELIALDLPHDTAEPGALKPELEKEWREALRIASDVLDNAWTPPEEKLRSAIRFRSAALMSGPNAAAFMEVPFLKDRQEFVQIMAVEGLDFYRKK